MSSRTDKPDRDINGNLIALEFNRAIIELRQGRAIAIGLDGRVLVTAALEVASEALLGRILSVAEDAVLLLTAERVAAAGLNGKGAMGPVAISIRQAGDLEALRAYGGLAGAPERLEHDLEVSLWAGSKPLAAAGFQLAKASRLVPALIAFETDRCDNDSVASVSVEAIREHCDLAPQDLLRISESRLPLAGAETSRIVLFRDEYTHREHVAVVIGNPRPGMPVPVRMHSACLTGDVFGSLRCDCGEQLRTAVRRLADLGSGVLLYLDQEGRGIGLANKLRAYSIQDSGLDTLDADGHLGFKHDERTYAVAAVILQNLGISRVEIMTNNPWKIADLREHGIDVVGRVPLVASTNSHNEGYLRAKRERAGHLAG